MSNLTVTTIDESVRQSPGEVSRYSPLSFTTRIKLEASGPDEQESPRTSLKMGTNTVYGAWDRLGSWTVDIWAASDGG